ncbi:MAG: choice-of-anchor L domain-containing protein, partial [Wenzhouxiangellaceae bacterium]
MSIFSGSAFALADDERGRLEASGGRVSQVADSRIEWETSAIDAAGWMRSAEHLRFARFEGHPAAVSAVDQYGEFRASGKGMLVLSTGLAEGAPARPGTDVRLVDGAPLHPQLRMRFEPPPGARHLSFRYQFLSAEFPDFVARGFNDEFSVTVIDARGERRMLLASSADSDLYPVASSFASGSPMDLYTRTPEQVQGEFDLGLPAAGTTGWRRAEIEIAQSGPVEVILSIADGGDGLVDSTVLLENLDLQAVRFELPDRTARAGVRGGVPGALDCIFQGGIVQGAVADGVTRLNFRFFGLSGPGTVVYSFSGGSQAPQDGGFDVPGGDQRLNTVSVPTALGPDGWESVAQYTVPDEFNRGGDEGVGNRFVNLRVDFIPDDPNDPPGAATVPLNLLRPALILMHGLWSNATTWNGSPLVSDSRLTTRAGDYRPTHAARFSRNTTRPATPIREACQTLRANG